AESDRYKYGPELAQRVGCSRLYPWHAFEIGTGRYAGAEQHKGSGRADQDRINKYRQHLDEALFDRMGHGGACRGVWSGTDSGLIGEQPPLDAVHDTGSCKSSEDSPEVKGV